MSQITITLPDGSKKKFDKGATGMDVAKSIGAGLAKAALACEVNGETKDLFYSLEEDADFKIFTWKDQQGKKAAWHTSEHVLTLAMMNLYPEKVKMAMGPATQEGFYFDFSSEKTFSPEDFELIEKEMVRIVKQDLKIRSEEVTVAHARTLFKGNEFKQEWLDEIEQKDEHVTVYWTGDDFVDLCKGPHVPSTGKCGVIKLLKVAGAYWRGDSDNEMLQRIYGVSFPTKKEMKKYLTMIEEAKKRDHRKLGKELDLVSFQEESPGSVFYHPKGAIMFRELQEYIRKEYRKRGFDEVITPLVYDKSLWETSGHWTHYKENMFVFKVDGREVSLKPMNCPSHCLIYKTNTRSYRDLPLRIADFAPLHRNELKGVLGGMTRVRKFNQDDAHIFCRLDQLEDEIDKAIDFANFVYEKTFKLDYRLELSTRPDKAIGSEEQWEKAETALKNALDRNKMEYSINEGDGAFYGPKIDLHIKDNLGRSWQLSTIQVDFNLPERFELNFEAADNTKQRPVMIHRAVLGTLDRFMGIIIEHFAGKFPLWLSPIQVRIMTINDDCVKFAKQVQDMFLEHDIRIELDDRSETVSKKVRDAQMDKVPVMITIGEKEIANDTLALRTLDGQVKFGVKKQDLLKRVLENIKNKELKFTL